MNCGFDSEKYLEEQAAAIMERAGKFDDKLYLEFGGKLMGDHHAARVLPGFDPDTKIKLLQRMKDKIDIVICIYSGDIEQRKMRADYGISYDADVMRTIDVLGDWDLTVKAVVVTRYQNQPAVRGFINRLSRRGIKVYLHKPIAGYPTELDTIVSSKGYGSNSYIETDKPIVVVTGPGASSGKMGTCLSQVYHDFQKGIRAGYAKFETFPVWNLPLKHPINVAYEAATADLQDVNMIDPFHLEAYGETAVNYNRDIEIYPVLDALFTSIYGANPYKSPTNMGVNMVGFCISNEDTCCEASKQEIIRRYFQALCRMANGACNDNEIKKLALLQKQVGINTAYRKTTVAARERKEQSFADAAAAIELPDGRIITAKSSALLGSSAALLLNVVKELAGIDNAINLIPQNMIEPIQKTKIEYLHGRNPRLHTDEVLVALSVLSLGDENCRKALEALPLLKGCQAHSTVMLNEVDQRTFTKLGINLTCDPSQS